MHHFVHPFTLFTQSHFYLKYYPVVIAAATFVFSCHTLKWPVVCWREIVMNTIEANSLAPEIVYDCLVDLYVV